MIKNIIWDFDGVILDSMPIRDYGFRKIFESYDSALVEKLLEYHHQNGGLSRYVKIRYFFEKILKSTISKEDIEKIANDFSIIMKKELINKKYLIEDSVAFIEKNYQKYHFHIASGSDEIELNYLCKELGIESYFLSINGSPTHKNELVKNILKEHSYLQNETILIGDSQNDYDAAEINSIGFYGYNSEALRPLGQGYIESFKKVLF